MGDINFTVFWIVVMVIAAIFESLTISIIAIWVVLGAFVAFVASLFGASILTQVILAIAVSIISLALLRPVFTKMLSKNYHKTNVDELIGEIGIVTEEIGKFKKGRVDVKHQSWAAVPLEDDVIPIGTEIKVLEVKGVKLIVTQNE